MLSAYPTSGTDSLVKALCMKEPMYSLESRHNFGWHFMSQSVCPHAEIMRFFLFVYTFSGSLYPHCRSTVKDEFRAWRPFVVRRLFFSCIDIVVIGIFCMRTPVRSLGIAKWFLVYGWIYGSLSFMPFGGRVCIDEALVCRKLYHC